MLFKYTVEPQDNYTKIEKFLASKISSLSQIHIARLIKEGACKIDGEIALLKRRIKTGDEITFHVENIMPNSMTPEDIPLEIVYEDDTILVVVKPSGMLVHPTVGVKTGTLLNAFAYHVNKTRDETNFIRPGLVHRLDRNTSGLMVITKTEEALSFLMSHFRRKLVRKLYLAIVEGNIPQDEMTIIAPIGRDETQKPKWNVRENGKESETRLRVLERKENLTLVELQPITGRTNQLRIHCTHIGHSIVGDDLHGGQAYSRLCLHAALLEFYHPVTDERISFSSLMPDEIANLL